MIPFESLKANMAKITLSGMVVSSVSLPILAFFPIGLLFGTGLVYILYLLWLFKIELFKLDFNVLMFTVFAYSIYIGTAFFYIYFILSIGPRHDDFLFRLVEIFFAGGASAFGLAMVLRIFTHIKLFFSYSYLFFIFNAVSLYPNLFISGNYFISLLSIFLWQFVFSLLVNIIAVKHLKQNDNNQAVAATAQSTPEESVIQ